MNSLKQKLAKAGIKVVSENEESTAAKSKWMNTILEYMWKDEEFDFVENVIRESLTLEEAMDKAEKHIFYSMLMVEHDENIKKVNDAIEALWDEQKS